MKRLIFSLVFLSLFAGITPTPASAEPLHDDPLCLPGPYAVSEDCLPFGSWAFLNHLAELGISFPLPPLTGVNPSIDLTYLPYYYGQVTAAPGPVFATIEDAIAGKPVIRYIEAGFDYISYIDVRTIDGKKFYMISPGEWMRGGDVSGGVATSQFMGFEFTATPERAFGWILQQNQARRAPGLNTELSDRQFNRWDVVQVYDSQDVDGITWHMVEPDLWIDSKEVALVHPVAEAPAGVDNGRWIEVNLFEQTMSVYENNQMIYATMLSTGVPGFWTRPGLFRITEKLETTPMTGAFEADRSDYYYLEDVPWTMYFDEARALHGAYWHTKFGYEQSHGCVNLSPGDSRWLYDWASVGDWVYVWDASGTTPEDPSLYSAGGA